MLLLLLFPMAKKAQHDFEHFDDVHCGVKDMHFCEAEHRCDICDYVFSTSSHPPKTVEQILMFSQEVDGVTIFTVFNTKTAPKFKLSLRGPPALG